MRETRLSGSEGGATLIPSSLPLSIIQSLRDKGRTPDREDAIPPIVPYVPGNDGVQGVNSNRHRHQSLRILAPSFSV